MIYVQFRTLARIIGRLCTSENWGFVYLTGDASLEHRTKAIKMFKDSTTVKILIAGLKCGGLGYVPFFSLPLDNLDSILINEGNY